MLRFISHFFKIAAKLQLLIDKCKYSNKKPCIYLLFLKIILLFRILQNPFLYEPSLEEM